MIYIGFCMVNLTNASIEPELPGTKTVSPNFYPHVGSDRAAVIKAVLAHKQQLSTSGYKPRAFVAEVTSELSTPAPVYEEIPVKG